MRSVWTLLILGVILSDPIYMQGTGNTAADCCLQTGNKRIPFSIVSGYEIQTVDSGCPIRALVFFTSTKPYVNLCATPGLPWVKKLTRKLDRLKGKGGKKSDNEKKPKKTPQIQLQ